ncbi:MAG: metallophosphoesterase [Pseudomonadota bacterium]
MATLPRNDVTHYDIIGDVHGQYGTLITLLETLGYRQAHGTWSQPGHQAVFVGDVIDKGEQPGEVLRLVRQMVDEGQAHMVIGNHELNWVRDAYLYQNDPRRFVHATREHHSRRRLVDEFAEQDSGIEALLDHFQWLREQPLFLQIGECRVVHAWWHEASIQRLSAMGIRCLDDRAMTAYEETYSPAYYAIDRVIAGCEHSLRSRASTSAFRTVRRRVRWWPNDVGMIHPMEFEPTLAREHGYPNTARPVFFGHYAMTGAPIRLGRNVACLDYAAAYGGELVAYTHSPEMPLTTQRFTTLPVTTRR